MGTSMENWTKHMNGTSDGNMDGKSDGNMGGEMDGTSQGQNGRTHGWTN